MILSFGDRSPADIVCNTPSHLLSTIFSGVMLFQGHVSSIVSPLLFLIAFDGEQSAICNNFLLCSYQKFPLFFLSIDEG